MRDVSLDRERKALTCSISDFLRPESSAASITHLPDVNSITSLASEFRGRLSLNHSALGQSAAIADDLSFPVVDSNTNISSNLHPGVRTRRTAANKNNLPTARVYSLSSAPPYSLSQV